MVAFVLFYWLERGGHIRYIRSWVSYCRASAARRRVGAVLVAPPSDEAHWGAGAVDRKCHSWERSSQWRLVVLGSEAMSEGHMAVIQLCEWGNYWVDIFTTEPAPHDKTCTVVMRVLGDQLGGMVWREENEDREGTARTVM